jgi:hypothetical protein
MRSTKRLRVQLRFVLFLVVLTVVGTFNGARAEQLTGTVRYNGAMGPVSSSRPILLLLIESGAAAVVTTNGGMFTFNGLAAGSYTLVYLLDVNNDGRLSVGEPALVYNNRSNLPGDPVTVPGPALTLQFNDDTLIPGISGTATYTGSKGTVNNTTRIRVHAYTDPGLTMFSTFEGRAKENGGRYDVIAFDSSPLYLLAFLDLNADDNFDSGEPFQIYNHKGAPPADGVVPGPHQTNINFMFGDENLSSGGTQLTGTVHYSGSLGTVSTATPIRLFLFRSDPFAGDTAQVATTIVTTNGGNFTLTAAAPGNYYLAYELDVFPNSEDNDVNVGEPFQAYNNRIAAPADPVALPKAGLALNFDDSGRLPGIGGNVTYTGSQFAVSSNTPLAVESFADPSLTGNAQNQAPISTNGGRYDFIVFDPTPLYLRAFLDANGNRQFDPGEPFQIYSGKDATPGDPVVPGPDRGAVDFEFGDATTATCAGDCNNDTFVTVDELITLADIALGIADVGTCSPGDVNHDARITIDEIVAAVNNALTECPAT